MNDFEIAVTNYTRNIERVNFENRHTDVIFYIRSDIKYSVCFNTAIEKNLWFLVIKIRLNNNYFTLAGVCLRFTESITYRIYKLLGKLVESNFIKYISHILNVSRLTGALT